MKNQDWERFGEEIKRDVQDAVDSGDFSRLNQTINSTLKGATDIFSDTLRNMSGKARGYQDIPRYGEAYYGEPQRKKTYSAVRKEEKEDYKRETRLALYGSTNGTLAGGILMCGFGYALSLMNLILLLVAIFVPKFGAERFIIAGIWGFFLTLTLVLGWVGVKKIGTVLRFRKYIRIFDGKEYCDIRQLAQQIRKKDKYVLKDMKRMIEKGWLRQGHLDREEKCVLVSHEAFHQYNEVMRQREEQQEQEAQKRAKALQEEEQEKAAKERLAPEVREVILAGEAYIQKIHTCNDAIPGEEISAKISKMEMLVDKIFERVEQNPEAVVDLHRMMNYYLPTTVKLLEAYEQLDTQPVQGANIISSKEEIEKTLDTLNIAFEKLLDAMFRDTAWDVSSDISVLNAMLAQEGLTESELEKVRKESGEL